MSDLLNYAHADQDVALNNFVNLLQNSLGENFNVDILNGGFHLAGHGGPLALPSIRISHNTAPINTTYAVRADRSVFGNNLQQHNIRADNVSQAQIDNIILPNIRTAMINALNAHFQLLNQHALHHFQHHHANAINHIHNIGHQQNIHHNVVQNLNQNNPNHQLG